MNKVAWIILLFFIAAGLYFVMMWITSERAVAPANDTAATSTFRGPQGEPSGIKGPSGPPPS